MTQLQIVGGGQMGGAIAAGLVSKGWAPAAEICVVDPDTDKLKALTSLVPGLETSTEPIATSGAVVAVKPPLVASVVETLAGLGVERVLSVAAGITLATLQESAGSKTLAMRAMPNISALAGAGTSAVCGGASATTDDFEWAEALLTSIGTCFVVEESAMDAVTAVSGSGPGYIFMIAEAMVEAAVLNGLPRDLAVGLVNSTIRGSGVLLEDSNRSAADLRSAVTSPGGTTAAGLSKLEAHGVRSAFMEAVSAAKRRSEELR